jgi:hypothetical protein
LFFSKIANEYAGPVPSLSHPFSQLRERRHTIHSRLSWRKKLLSNVRLRTVFDRQVMIHSAHRLIGYLMSEAAQRPIRGGDKE